jgi:DNA-binding NarL/FixJ family response regulator
MPESNETRITLVLVDDHAIVRQGVRAFLQTQPDIEIAGEAETGDAAVRICRDCAPDVVLMDLVMPGSHLDGVEATREVKRVSPRSQVIILTSYHDDEHILPAIRAGALSYLLKDVNADVLAEAVRRAARGEATLHPGIASRVIQSLQQAPPRDRLLDLSERELEVLRQIAMGRSNAAIAEALVISEKTVKSHVSNILSKLHLSDRTQAAVYAWRTGMVKE